MPERSSPNFDSREGHPVDMLVLHYTGMPSAGEALERLCDPAAKVSAHYMVDEDGTVYRLVPEEMRAWHAGVSSWRGHTNINQRSIGIELVNPGHEFGYRPFPQAQMQALAALCKEILGRNAIPPRNVVGHSDVAPTRKEDPGELFDWQWLAGQGVGLWPAPPMKYAVLSTLATILETIVDLVMGRRAFVSPMEIQASKHLAFNCKTFQAQLIDYGYSCPQTGMFDEETRKVILAFQRHFRPVLLNGKGDFTCAALLATLLSMV